MRIYIIGNDGITLCRDAPASVTDGEIATPRVAGCSRGGEAIRSPDSRPPSSRKRAGRRSGRRRPPGASRSAVQELKVR